MSEGGVLGVVYFGFRLGVTDGEGSFLVPLLDARTVFRSFDLLSCKKKIHFSLMF